MKKLYYPAVMFVASVMVLVLAGCGGAPTTPEEKQGLHSDVQAALDQMKAKDSGINNLLNTSYGYAIFPSIGKGGLVVGGAYGRGEVYQQGRLVGYSEVTQANVGLQAGGQTYSELILFQTPEALQKFQAGNWTPEASATAVALKEGAAGAARWQDGIVVFANPRGGLMAGVTIGGQKFNYQPLGAATTRPTGEGAGSEGQME